VAKNPTAFGRTKHVAIRHMYVRDLTEQGRIEPSYVSTNEQLADILTKVGPKFVKQRDLIGLCRDPEIHSLKKRIRGLQMYKLAGVLESTVQRGLVEANIE
jgi:hypothetical protein